MDELAPQSTAQVSTGRRRLKTIILVVAGIVVLTLGAVGYLTYNTVKENISKCSGEPARIIQAMPSHQPSSLSSQTPRITYTSSMITLTTKQPTTHLVPTNIRSTSTESNDISSSTKLTESISSSMAVESTSHQTSSLSSQSTKMTSTSSIVTGTTKQPSTLLVSTNLLSTSSASTKSISTSTESTESISSSLTVVTTEQTSQVNLLTSCESESSPDLDTSPLDCSYIEPCNSGVYYVFPYGEGNDSVPVYCECYGEGEMWTVIQKRFDGSVNFDRNWTDYKNGFGDSCGEYWLGNEVLHQLTTKEIFKLKITMTHWNSFTKFADYDSFSLADEADGYRLSLGSYYGNAGNSMLIHNGYPFSTGDKDNDANVNMSHAVRYSGAWWYSDGLQSNLNGLYYPSPGNPDHDGIIWLTSFGYDSLQEVTIMMMINQNIE